MNVRKVVTMFEGKTHTTFHHWVEGEEIVISACGYAGRGSDAPAALNDLCSELSCACADNSRMQEVDAEECDDALFSAYADCCSISSEIEQCL